MKNESSDPPILLTGSSLTGTTPATGGSRADADAPAIPGYRLLSEIHRGGQGVVYLAVEESTGRRVALKAMRDGPLAGQRERLRFEREIRILAQLRHPGIVAIHARGRAAGVDYFVMEYISGRDLKEHVDSLPDSGGMNTGQSAGATPGKKPGATKLQTILVLFAEICDAVDVAHQHGIVHRDLKPSNVRVDLDGRPHLLDFGLARSLAPLAPEAAPMTQTGDFMGSLPWTSPEQASGSAGHVDARSDVYSLGVMLFQLLTGRFPYDVLGSMPDVVRNITTTEPRRPRALTADIPAEVESIVLKCLKKGRDERYFCAGAIAADVRRYLAGEPIQASFEGTAQRLRTRTRNYAARRPAVLIASIVLASIAISTFAMQFIRLPISRTDTYERFVAGLRAATMDNDFQHVRLITISDTGRMSALASRLDLKGVDPGMDWPSVRSMHGALMEKLATAGPVVVAWDIRFLNNSDFDVDLVRGVEAILRAGGDVVVGTRDWRLRPDGKPAIIDALPEAGAKWGAMTKTQFAGPPWELELVLRSPQKEPMPSLALAACMAHASPGEALTLEVDDDRINVLRATSRAPTRVTPNERRAPADLLPVFRLSADDFHVQPFEELEAGDRMGMLLVTLGPDKSFADAALDYEQIFVKGPSELREWIGGRIVLIGDTRPDGGDFHPYGANRTLPGVYGHAAGIEALQRGSMLVLAGWKMRTALVAFGALAGVFCFRRWDRRTRRLLLALFLSGIILFVATTACGVFFRFVCHPLIPWMAFALAMGLATVVHRGLRLSGESG